MVCCSVFVDVRVVCVMFFVSCLRPIDCLQLVCCLAFVVCLSLVCCLCNVLGGVC